MNGKTSADVRRRVTGGEAAIPVIVTVQPGTESTILRDTGLTVERVFENISAVAGTATPGAVDKLEALPVVERIEYDGPMHAI